MGNTNSASRSQPGIQHIAGITVDFAELSRRELRPGQLGKSSACATNEKDKQLLAGATLGGEEMPIKHTEELLGT